MTFQKGHKAVRREKPTLEELSAKFTLPLDLKAIQTTVDRTPEIYRERYVESLTGEGGLRNAIDTKCRECVGFEEVYSRVGECTVRKCPLWFYRPYQRGESCPAV